MQVALTGSKEEGWSVKEQAFESREVCFSLGSAKKETVLGMKP